jgi:predicted enzyme related to lactoylglutathione lyase
MVFVVPDSHGGAIMLLGLRTVAYHVSNIAAGKEWYTKVVGHPPYFDQPFYVGFEVGGFELGLVPDGKPGAGGTLAYWGTADIDAEVARLVGLGAKLQQPIQDVGEGIRVADLSDPFGNTFGVILNPHFDKAKVG